jgi:hypothetical protein
LSPLLRLLLSAAGGGSSLPASATSWASQSILK